ncbi:MAG: hypothetical protein PHG48_06710, partial [Eubacteriales bacterium]|nr:hypothetical protein [Eubacteriales bacterium]
QVTLAKGKTYTLSGYIRTENISSSSNKSALLYLSYQDTSGMMQLIPAKSSLIGVVAAKPILYSTVNVGGLNSYAKLTVKLPGP